MRNLAILSVIFEDTPGFSNNFIDDFDLMNVPNPGIPKVKNFFS